MENNQTDFMKNRPVAAFANQAKDVYGSQQSSTRITLTVVLILLMIAGIILSLIYGNYYLLAVFTAALMGLIISIVIGKRADRYHAPVDDKFNENEKFNI